MSNRIRHYPHRNCAIGEGESKLVLVKILFFATGFLLTYENLFGVFDDVKLRLLSILIGGSLMFLGCKDTFELIIDECFYSFIPYNIGRKTSQEHLKCTSPSSLTLQTINVGPRQRRSNGKKTSNDENTESTQINSFVTSTLP